MKYNIFKEMQRSKIMAEIKITKDNFENEVKNSSLPVLLDFWATWCGPCMMLSPVIEEVARETEGKVKVCKVNVDAPPELAAAFSIASIPTPVVMKAGTVVKSAVGYREKAQILELLK